MCACTPPTGYTEKIEEVTGTIKYFLCEGVADLKMFAGLLRLGGTFDVIVRWSGSARVVLVASALCCSK